MILDVVANGDKPHQQKTIIRSYEHWHNNFWWTKIFEANNVWQKIDMHLLSLYNPIETYRGNDAGIWSK